MNPADLLAHLRARSRPTRPSTDDHHTAAVHTADPDRPTEITTPAPKPPERPERAEHPRAPGKLAALTPALGRQKAGQALWAPDRLTSAERKIADRVLKEFDHA
jgi:hypothetical protein